MNSLHQLNEGPLIRPISVSEQDMRLAMSWWRSWEPQAVCFWMGEIDGETHTVRPIPELASLPYDCCWFEFDLRVDDTTVVRHGLALDRRDDKLRLASYFRNQEHQGSHWSLQTLASWSIWNSLHYETKPSWCSNPERERWAHYQLLMVGTFLSALNCKNVERVLNKPDAKRQQARARKGKAPLFSYWTLVLPARLQKGLPQGGTHASPRVHLRRGHPREYAQGLYTWVQPAVVGNKSMGMVHKDYAVAPGKKEGE